MSGKRLPEFAFIGRSNVGKSSLINSLCRQGKLAHTSSTPKTRLINHYLINDRWYMVDLPGYGYAKISREDRKELGEMIRSYINLGRRSSSPLFVLLDSRHPLQKVDLSFLIELGEAEVPFSRYLQRVINGKGGSQSQNRRK